MANLVNLASRALVPIVIGAGLVQASIYDGEPLSIGRPRRQLTTTPAQCPEDTVPSSSTA